MVHDGLFPRGRHKNHVSDTCLRGFFDCVLNQRFVDHGNHFLRNRLGGWEKTGPKPCHGENHFANRRSHKNAFNEKGERLINCID